MELSPLTLDSQAQLAGTELPQSSPSHSRHTVGISACILELGEWVGRNRERSCIFAESVYVVVTLAPLRIY